ncbi:MAG: WYL domain-containing protein [Nitrospinae bacterium]|nr:WYL domain-containing protein [Nitrospinota bacterium]
MKKRLSPSHLTHGQKLASILLRLINAPSGVSVADLRGDYSLEERTFRNYIRDLQNIPSLVDENGGPLVVKEKENGVAYLRLKTGVIGDGTAEFFASFYMASSLMSYLAGTGMHLPLDNWEKTLRKNRLKFPVNHLDKKIHSVAELPKDYSGKDEVLRIALRAVLDQRRVNITYKSASSGKTSRHDGFMPYTLMQYRFGLYVIGRSDGKQDGILTLSVDRIQKIAIRPEKFHYPSDYSPAAIHGDGWGIMRGGKLHHVEILFDASEEAYVMERKYHKSAKLRRLANGDVRLTMTVGALEQLVPWVLSWGYRARVVGPMELVETIKKEIAELAGKYRV